jgi:hypothetical protein
MGYVTEGIPDATDVCPELPTDHVMAFLICISCGAEAKWVHEGAMLKRLEEAHAIGIGNEPEGNARIELPRHAEGRAPAQ